MISSNPEAQPTTELELDRIRDLTRRRRYAEALAAAQALAAGALTADSSRDVLYVIAANQRCLSQVDEALATLERLEQQHPRYGRLFQERGYCFVALRNPRRAIEAFQRGVSLDPALSHCWSMLERLYDMTGDTQNAAIAARQVKLDYIRALLVRQMYSRARDELDALPANDRQSLALRATANAALGEHEKAIASFRELLTVTPEFPELHLELAHSLQATGRSAAAIDSCRAALEAKADFADAWWSLANLKTYRFAEDEIARMRTAEAKPGIRPVDRYHLCFALGKALEDRADFAQSWQYYERGNALKSAESHYRAEVNLTNTRTQMEVCTTQLFTAHAGGGAPDPDPIFIVGLPRSGSTLLEQILASHCLVEGTQELPDIQHIVLELQGHSPNDPQYPAALARLTREDFRNLGERYLANTRIYRTGKPFFIDKMPNNFRHLGLIHLMLPNAKVIDVRREPMACCFSNLKQLFAGGQEFTYSMADLAGYYRTYLELMRHWDAVLPGRVLRVHYEDVVDDLEANVRRVLDFCGLEFESACVEFHNTRRSVRTASSEQVRQPLFRAGLNQWRHYEPWLAPLKEALGDALIRYRD